VDDYASNLMVFNLMLEHLGYKSEAVHSGQEAINLIRTKNSPYAAILMDVQMPEMNGFECTQQIRALEKEKGFRSYIIGVTAHALAEVRERCLASGMDEFISKPVYPDILAQKLKPFLKSA
jgi:CheY-like chemotaxis protein